MKTKNEKMVWDYIKTKRQVWTKAYEKGYQDAIYENACKQKAEENQVRQSHVALLNAAGLFQEAITKLIQFTKGPL